MVRSKSPDSRALRRVEKQIPPTSAIFSSPLMASTEPRSDSRRLNPWAGLTRFHCGTNASGVIAKPTCPIPDTSPSATRQQRDRPENLCPPHQPLQLPLLHGGKREGRVVRIEAERRLQISQQAHAGLSGQQGMKHPHDCHQRQRRAELRGSGDLPFLTGFLAAAGAWRKMIFLHLQAYVTCVSRESAPRLDWASRSPDSRRSRSAAAQRQSPPRSRPAL